MQRKMIYTATFIVCLTFVQAIHLMISEAHAATTIWYNCWYQKTVGEPPNTTTEDVITDKFKIQVTTGGTKKRPTCTFEVDGKAATEEQLKDNAFRFCGTGKGEKCEGGSVSGNKVKGVSKENCEGAVADGLAWGHCKGQDAKCEFRRGTEPPTEECASKKKKDTEKKTDTSGSGNMSVGTVANEN